MKQQILSYNKNLLDLARSNRKSMTKGEVILWGHLKGKKLQRVKFSRQIIVENYIIDFYSKELKLAIEVQGYSHLIEEVARKGKDRTERLTGLGIRVLEIDDQEIFNDIDNAISGIKYEILKMQRNNPPRLKAPLQGGY